MPRRRRESEPETQWWEIPTRLQGCNVVVRVREPASTSLGDLLLELHSGAYRRPFIVDDGRFRRLHFGLRYVQSEMRLRAPDALTQDYTQKMMAFLLFQPQPQHLVLVGLGGGSLTRFCHRWLPQTVTTTVEIDAGVIGMAREMFRLPEPDERLRLVEADAMDYFSQSPPTADAVLVDGCDRLGIAPSLCGESVYRNIRRSLAPDGVVVVNLVGRARRAERLLATLHRVFDGRVIEVPIPVHEKQRLAFAFNGPTWPPDWIRLEQRAAELGAALPLAFPQFARLLQRHYRKPQALSRS